MTKADHIVRTAEWALIAAVVAVAYVGTSHGWWDDLSQVLARAWVDVTDGMFDGELVTATTPTGPDLTVYNPAPPPASAPTSTQVTAPLN